MQVHDEAKCREVAYITFVILWQKQENKSSPLYNI